MLLHYYIVQVSVAGCVVARGWVVLSILSRNFHSVILIIMINNDYSRFCDHPLTYALLDPKLQVLYYLISV